MSNKVSKRERGGKSISTILQIIFRHTRKRRAIRTEREKWCVGKGAPIVTKAFVEKIPAPLLTFSFRQFKASWDFLFPSLTLPFLLSGTCFQSCNARTFLSVLHLLLPSLSPTRRSHFSRTRAFLTLKPRRVYSLLTKAAEWKAMRLLNARVNVNNDNGSATRGRKAEWVTNDGPWGGKEDRENWLRETLFSVSLSSSFYNIYLHRRDVIRKDAITPPINGSFWFAARINERAMNKPVLLRLHWILAIPQNVRQVLVLHEPYMFKGFGIKADEIKSSF